MSATPTDPDNETGVVLWGEVRREFALQIDACVALKEWAVANRPDGPPTSDGAGDLLLRIYARSSKTCQASLRLTMIGYGEHAGMLNRSLFEDVLIAHWVKLNPDAGVERIEMDDRYRADLFRMAAEKHAYTELDELEPLSDEERKQLGGEFRRGVTWTGLSLYDLTKAVESEWPSEQDKRILWQLHDIVNRFNIMLLHQTAHALKLTAQKVEGGRAMAVGPSLTHIRGALIGAFWPYANTVSLLCDDEQAEKLSEAYAEHLPAFLTFREVEQPGNQPDAGAG